ncbi:MAG: hypothetical protein OEZ45_10190, partial [Candidatus Aminicenantes bacterium]|nr:hypothetical protein [Candidatus Aminicenantes bacterium]
MKKKSNILKKWAGIFFLSLVIAVSFSACKTEGKLLDMTYTYDEDTIYWPTAESFKLEKVGWKISE